MANLLHSCLTGDDSDDCQGTRERKKEKNVLILQDVSVHEDNRKKINIGHDGCASAMW